MALITRPAPAPMQTGGDILNFLLQMSSAEDRKRYYRDVEKRTDLAKRQLDLAEKEWTAGKPLRKEAKVISKGRRRTIKGLMLTEKQLAMARHTLATSIAYGDKDAADVSRFMIKKLEGIKKDSPIALETILFADDLYKDTRAQLALAQQQALNANQTTELTKIQAGFEKQQMGSTLNAVSSAITPENVDAGVGALRAVAVGDMDTFNKMYASMKATAAKKKTEPEERVFRPSNLYTNVIEQFGTGTYQQLLAAEAANLPYPEVRSVYIDRVWPWGNIQKLLTRDEAKSKGWEDKWLEASPIDLEKMGERIQPQTDKKKTVKELASEKAKKTKPAGGKAVRRPASKESRGGYTVGQVIGAGGKKYRVTGFDTDGEPLVVEVK